jgi:UDP-glucose 4-epimerase
MLQRDKIKNGGYGQPRRVIVTGGAGFIGSHLVERLCEAGHKVIVLDNYSTGRPQNLDHLCNYLQLTIHKVDIVNHSAILPFFQGANWVFHLAALVDIVPSIQRPMDYFRANVEGTTSVMEAARKGGVQRFVYTASSSCYGIPKVYPTPETAEIQPKYPYALTKYLGEQIVLHWAQVYKLPAVSLRLFNVFGPRTRTSGTYGAVFGVFLAQKLAGKPFTVVGDGNQTRDFTFVSDVVDALVKTAESEISGEVFNIGSGGTYSVNRIVELLGGDVVHIPKRPSEPDCTFADITKARQALGWVPRISFAEGVHVMLQNIEYWRQAPVWDPASISDATLEWFAYLGKPDPIEDPSSKGGK